MRTAYEIVRRIAETAMSRHGLDARKLASAAGISEKSMVHAIVFFHYFCKIRTFTQNITNKRHIK